MAEAKEPQKKLPENPLPEKKPFVPIVQPKPFVYNNPQFNKFWSKGKSWGGQPAIRKHAARSR